MKVKVFFKISTLFVVALFTSLVFQSCDNKKDLTPAELDGYWVLKSLNGKDAKTVFTGAIPTLEFDFKDSLVYGTGGCNRYNGSFTYAKGIFSAPNLATTKMLCTEDNAEPQFLLALSDVNNILSIVDGVLTVTHDGKKTLEFEKGTPHEVTQTVNPDSNTLKGNWSLKVIDGADAKAKFNEQVPFITFDFENNKVSGNAGCNRYNATFSITEDMLVVGPLMSTKMFCDNMEGEAQFTQAIADTSMLSLPNENILQLTKNGIVLLEFEKTADPSCRISNTLYNP